MDSTIPFLPKSEISNLQSSSLAVQTGFCNLVGNPGDRFSHDAIHVFTWQVLISAREARWPSGRASDSGARGRGFDSHSCPHVVSLSKIHLPPKKYW